MRARSGARYITLTISSAFFLAGEQQVRRACKLSLCISSDQQASSLRTNGLTEREHLSVVIHIIDRNWCSLTSFCESLVVYR